MPVKKKAAASAAVAAPAPMTPQALLAFEEQKIKVVRRLIAAKKSATSLESFTRFTMPDPVDVDDTELSLYQAGWHHKAICELLEKVDKGIIHRAIITLGPRHGKSELVSRRFPAWFMGHDPYRQVILATYGADFAEDFGRKVREIMDMPAYRQVFPRVSLKVKSKAVDRMETEAGGMMVFTGVGGPIVGRGADCVVGSTIVSTEIGPMSIESIYAMDNPPLVLSFDHQAQQTRYNRILATRRIENRDVVKIVTAEGRELVGTPDHRIYSASRGRYVPLASLDVGEVLDVRGCNAAHLGASGSVGPIALRDAVLEMRGPLREAEVRGGQGASQGACGPLLHAEMCAGPPRHKECTAVRCVRHASPEIEAVGAANGANLLSSLLQGAQIGARLISKATLSAVRNMVLAGDFAAAVLLSGLRKFSALGPDGGGGEFPLQGRHFLREVVRRDEGDRAGARWECMRGLRHAESHGGSRDEKEIKSAHSPHRFGPEKQSRGESCSDVLHVPRRTSQIEKDAVALVERVRDGKVDVYDIQVERDCNFFANEVLVHNCLIIDDPHKSRQTAESLLERNRVWEWFTSVAYTRLMPAGRIVIIMQRWHEDDLVGRIFNRDFVPKEEADKWFHLDLPAIIEEGQPEERALWPERYPLEVLKSTRAFVGDRDWNSLYMGRPTPPSGVFFTSDMIHTYNEEEYARVLKNHRVYMAGDLAVSTDKKADESCVLVAMVDENDTIYISPDIYWERRSADQSVEKIIDMIEVHNPMSTWWEKGVIARSVGPLLFKRMQERKCYSSVIGVPVTGDKGFRAVSIRGRMSMAKVKFPSFATKWWPRAKDQLIKFTGSGEDAADDFVDALALIGLGLSKQLKADAPSNSNVVNFPKTGTLRWIRAASDYEARERKRQDKGGF